jgi:hypothetical protein
MRETVIDQPWTETKATVVACKRIWSLPYVPSTPSDLPMASTDYVVTFTYQAYGGEYSGKYLTRQKEEIGHTFDISHDPENPRKNSGGSNIFNVYFQQFQIPMVILVIILIWMYARFR